MMDHYIEIDGVPVAEPDLMKWCAAFEDSDRRRVAMFERKGVMVSTVFLGTDHAFGQGVPILYETMVFGGPLDGEQDRYATRAEARIGHVYMVKRACDASRWWITRAIRRLLGCA